MPRTRSSGHADTSQGGDHVPPVPTNLADAVAALVHATTENTRLMRELAQRDQNIPHGNCARRNQQEESTYPDFANTHPPKFSKADEPLEAEDWLRTMELKFELIPCTEYQKPVFAAQQLRGAAGAWWANFLAEQPAGHQVTWAEFRDAFRAHYISQGVMAMKLEEFLSLKQGDMPVLQYVGKFNHLCQYATEHVNTDPKKKQWFMRGLNAKLQTMMTIRVSDTYHEVVNMAISSEEKYCLHKEAKKKKDEKNVSTGSSSGNAKRLKIVYHPVPHHNYPPFCPQQFQPRQQSFARPAAALSYPCQPNAPGIRSLTPQTQQYTCFNCGKPGHLSKECPNPRQGRAV